MLKDLCKRTSSLIKSYQCRSSTLPQLMNGFSCSLSSLCDLDPALMTFTPPPQYTTDVIDLRQERNKKCEIFFFEIFFWAVNLDIWEHRQHINHKLPAGAWVLVLRWCFSGKVQALGGCFMGKVLCDLELDRILQSHFIGCRWNVVLIVT